MRSGREPIDTSTPSGRLIFQTLASFAEYDRENIREGKHTGGHLLRLYPVRAEDGRLEVVEEETEAAYWVKHRLVQLLVAGIKAGMDPDGQVDIRITYRFGPPSAEDGEVVGAGAGFVSTEKNS